MQKTIFKREELLYDFLSSNKGRQMVRHHLR